MVISYNKLLKMLVDNNMTRRDLIEFAGVTSNVCAQILKQEPIPMSAAIKICAAFECSIGDIMEFTYDDEKPNYRKIVLPGLMSDYVLDPDYLSGLTRIYTKISNPNDPNGKPLLAFVTIVNSSDITPEMFPDDPSMNPMYEETVQSVMEDRIKKTAPIFRRVKKIKETQK